MRCISCQLTWPLTLRVTHWLAYPSVALDFELPGGRWMASKYVVGWPGWPSLCTTRNSSLQ